MKLQRKALRRTVAALALSVFALSAPAHAVPWTVVIDGVRFNVHETPAASRLVVSIALVSPNMAIPEHGLILGLVGDIPPQASFERAARHYLRERGGNCRIVDSVEWRKSQRWFTYRCGR